MPRHSSAFDRDTHVPLWAWPLVIGLGIFLRCWHLSQPSVWLDEAFSYYFVSGDITRALQAENTNPPVYYVLLYYWTKLFGYSEAALRSLSVLFGCLVLLAYTGFLNTLFSGRLALLGLLLLALSPFHIYYAQEARCFTLLSLFLINAAWALSVLLRKDGRLQHYVWLWASCTLSIYTHFIAVFFVAAFAAAALLLWNGPRRNLLKVLGCFALTGLCFVPWLMTMLETAGSGGGQVRRYLLLKLPQTFFSFLYGDSLIPLNEEAVRAIGSTLKTYAVILLLALGVGAYAALSVVRQLLTRSAVQASLWLCALFCGLPVLTAFLVSFKVMLFDERYLIAASLFLYPLVAAGIVHGFSRSGSLLALTGHIGLLLISLYGYYYNPQFGREEWRDVASFVEENISAHEKTVFLFDVGYIDVPFHYYYKIPARSIRALNNYVDPLPEQFPWLEEVRSLDTLWLIRAHAENDRVLETIRTYFSVQLHQHYANGRGIDVYKLVARTAESLPAQEYISNGHE